MPAIVISRAGNNSVIRLKTFEAVKEVRQDVFFIGNEIAGEDNQIDRLLFQRGFDFLQQFFVRVGPVMNVGELGDPEAVKGRRPTGKNDVLFSD